MSVWKRRRRAVEIGARFRKVGVPKPVWTVHRLVVDSEGIRHFQLRDENERSKAILISERALLDHRYFEPVELS